MSAIKSYIARMGHIQRILLAAVFVAIEVFAAYQLIYIPKLAALDLEKKSMLANKATLSNPKTMKMLQKISGPVQTTGEHKDILAKQGNRLFDKKSRDAFVSGLAALAKESGLDNFASKEAKDKSGALLVKIDNPGGGHETIQATRAAYDLVFKGQYAALYRFLERLRDSGNYIKVGNLTAQSENNTSNLAVTMTLYLYSE